MTLLDDLTGSLGAGGFDLGATVGSTGGALGGISVTPGTLNLGPLQSAAGAIGGVDLSAIAVAAADAAGQVRALIDGRPAADDLVAPLVRRLEALERLATVDVGSLAGSFRAPAGADRFAGAVAALPSVGGGALAAVGALFPGFQPAAALGTAGAIMAPLLELVAAVQQFAAISSDSVSAARLATGLAGLVQAAGFPALAQEVNTRAADLQALAASVANAPLAGLNDPAVVDPLLAAADAVTANLAASTALPGHWLETCLAAVERADVPALIARVNAAAAALGALDFGPVEAMAGTVRGWLEPLMALDVATGPPDVDAFVDELRSRVNDLVNQLDGIDLAGVEVVIRPAVNGVLEPVRAVEEAAHDVVTAVESALEGLRAAVEAVDLQPVFDAIRSVVEPVTEALTAIQAGVAAAGAVLDQVAAGIAAAAGQAQATLGEAATAVGDAFARVKQALDDVDLAGVQAQVEGAVAAMAEAVAGAPVAPVFDTAVTVIDRTANVVHAAPLDLLPADTRQELQSKVAPIKAINFEAEVTRPLKAALDDIVDQLDTSVLDTLRAAYARVVEFLESIDPTAAIDTLQRQAFDPLMERLGRLDPAHLLAPVVRAVDQAKQALAGFDPAEALAGLDDAVGQVSAAVAAFDPATLVEPLAARVDALRNGMAVTTVRLLLDSLSTEIDRIVDLVARPFSLVDKDTLTAAVDGLLDVLGEAAVAATPSARTIHALVRLAGGATGAVSGLVEAADWVAGRADPIQTVAERLDQAAGGLEATAQAIGALNLALAQAAVEPPFQTFSSAVDALPASALKTGLAPLVLRVDPAVLLAFPDQRDRAAAAVREAAELLRALASTGRSELQVAAQGLRRALLPVREALARLRLLLRRFGGAPLDDPVAAVRSVVAGVRQSDVFDPLADALVRLLQRIPAGLRVGLVAPLKEFGAEVEALLAQLDIRFVNDELAAIQQAVVAKIDEIRPSVLLAGVLGPAQATIDALVELNVLAPVDAVVAAVADTLEALEEFAPTKLLHPAVEIHGQIVTMAGALDVDRLAGPVVDALHAIEQELDTGLDQAGAAFQRLQDALP